MKIINKITVGKTSLILLYLVLIIFFSGCVEKEIFNTNLGNKVSAEDEINTSFLLINSAETRMISVRQDVESGTYTTAKMNLNASKIDFEEALKILNNATSDYEEENQEIERYKTLAEVGLDRVHSMESLVKFMEHLDKSIAYIDSEELNLSRKELDLASEALNESAVSSSSAKEKVFMIDLNSVPVEQKSSIMLLRTDLETSETMHAEFQKMISGMYPFMDGYMRLSSGVEYAEAEKWDKAANEFGKASEEFSESYAILEELKNSEYSEVSLGAIEICGILTRVQKDLPHLEAGCRYMEKDRYNKAMAEFNNISTYY